jgi:hypothetical protein
MPRNEVPLYFAQLRAMAFISGNSFLFLSGMG